MWPIEEISMTVTLTEDAARYVDEQVRSGRYPSAAAAVDAALTRLRSEGCVVDDELRALVDVGLSEADGGEFVEFTAEYVIAERRVACLARQQGQP